MTNVIFSLHHSLSPYSPHKEKNTPNCICAGWHNGMALIQFCAPLYGISLCIFSPCLRGFFHVFHCSAIVRSNGAIIYLFRFI